MPRLHFHLQLAELKDKLLAMAALSQLAVETAVDAYVQRNASVCLYVRDNETAINAAQREVDEMAYELLAKEQPMAIDLRFILAVIKINSELERIGDQSMGIAARTLELLQKEPVDLPFNIEEMGEYTGRMIRSAIQSLLDGDAPLAESVREMDDEIDAMYKETRLSLVDLIQTSPEKSEQALHAILVARNMERIADHAANIATDVIFWIRGADLRHQLSLAED